jgi:hypothetical protein
MSWNTEMPVFLRVLLNDTSDDPTYTDARLRELASIAALYVSVDIANSTYAVDVETFSITPDPTIDPRDNSFIALVGLKAACLIGRSEAKTAAGQSIDVKDGTSSVGLKGIGKAKLDISNSLCEDYQKAKLAYMTGDNMGFHAIVSPFHVWAENQACRPRYWDFS